MDKFIQVIAPLLPLAIELVKLATAGITYLTMRAKAHPRKHGRGHGHHA